jgi:hypothetical protein
VSPKSSPAQLFRAPTIPGEKSFPLFLKIAKIGSRTAKFLMDDLSFASPLSLFSVESLGIAGAVVFGRAL